MPNWPWDTPEQPAPPPPPPPPDEHDDDAPALEDVKVGELVAYPYHDPYHPQGARDVVLVGSVVAVVDAPVDPANPDGDTRPSAVVAWHRDLSQPMALEHLHQV